MDHRRYSVKIRLTWNNANFTWDANNMAAGVYVINAEFEGKSISHNVSLIK